MSKYDIYSKEQLLISIDEFTPEFLYRIAEVSEKDESIERMKEALEFSMQFFSDSEVEFIFLRFVHGNSYKTLKSTAKLGSTKTALKHTRKLSAALREYILYALNYDYDEDISFIRDQLGNDAAVVAGLMFRRRSRHQIKTDVRAMEDVTIGNKRLQRIILDVELLALKYVRLTGFWNVIKLTGKFG